MRKTFKTKIVRDGSMCFIPVPFDPRPIFGKVRAPVKVTLNEYTYRSTIASMGFARASKATPLAWAAWRSVSYSHQREHVEAIEGAKQSATRVRRIDRALAALGRPG